MGGVPAGLSALRVRLHAQLYVCGPGACTRAHCDSAPCDMLGGALWLLVAYGLCWVPRDKVGFCEVGCMAQRGAGAPKGA